MCETLNLYPMFWRLKHFLKFLGSMERKYRNIIHFFTVEVERFFCSPKACEGAWKELNVGSFSAVVFFSVTFNIVGSFAQKKWDFSWWSKVFCSLKFMQMNQKFLSSAFKLLTVNKCDFSAVSKFFCCSLQACGELGTGCNQWLLGLFSPLLHPGKM